MLTSRLSPRLVRHARRSYRVLALESSCDDSCVALLEKQTPAGRPIVVDHYKLTLSLAAAGGIIPTAAQVFHNYTVGGLVDKMATTYNFDQNPPDLICVTKGPGMAGSLTASIQLAKGLALAWKVPLVGVHHMLGHLLTPQLDVDVKYPFLSLLCSGGHTMLVYSKSVGHHEVIINTMDIAVGDSLDKCAREIGFYGNQLAREMEEYIRKNPWPAETTANVTEPPIDLALGLPMKGPKYPRFPDKIEFTFASFLLRVQTTLKRHPDAIDEKQRQYMAHHIQNMAFDHIIDRINVSLMKHGTNKKLCPTADGKFDGVIDIVCSGGVAANKVLRHKLSHNLKFRETLGHEPTFHFPPLDLCTDNAIMIGLAGIEQFEKLRIMSDMLMVARPKWPINELMDELWVPVDDATYDKVTKYNL